jgi:hypothetical protein
MNAIEQQHFTTTFVVAQSPRVVFDAVTNVRGWWSDAIEGGTARLNDTFIFEVKDVHYAKIKLIEVVPDQKVVWLVQYNYLSFVKDKTEWTGTTVHFDITPVGEQTQLRFTHVGLVPEFECYDVCVPAWTSYIQGSLLPLIATGVGRPNQERA